MRNFIPILIVFTLTGWSQPAQQQSQPPIVINNVTPRESFWIGLLKLAIPTVVAAVLASGITLYGVKQTNKNNKAENEANRKAQAAENEASRKHQLEVEIAKAEIAAKHRSLDRKWEFRKEVYSHLIQVTIDVLGLCIHRKGLAESAKAFKHTGFENTPEYKALADSYAAKSQEFYQWTTLAPLASAQAVQPTIVKMGEKIFRTVPFNDPTFKEVMDDQLLTLGQLISMLQIAAQRDLWGAADPTSTPDLKTS